MRKNIISPFIELIWNIVEDPTNDHIISWSPNGTSFLINDQQAFSNEMLSKHFKHGNLSSFIRQVLEKFNQVKHVQFPQKQKQLKTALIFPQTFSARCQVTQSQHLENFQLGLKGNHQRPIKEKGSNFQDSSSFKNKQPQQTKNRVKRVIISKRTRPARTQQSKHS